MPIEVRVTPLCPARTCAAPELQGLGGPLADLTHTDQNMKQDEDYEATKKALLEDIAKGCDVGVVERTRGMFEAWESCTSPEPRGGVFHATVSTNEDVKRLTTVNALAVLAMLAVAVVALVVRK